MNRRARLSNTVALAAVRATVAAILLLLAAAVVRLIVLGWSELIRPGFYGNAPNIAGPGGGVGPQLFNTLYVLILSLLIVVPVGVLAGIHFAEYAGVGRATNLVRRATETLATLPSIVVGLFGYALFVQTTHSSPNRLAAALSLSVINLPYVVRVTEDALRALPQAAREGSLALGATRWQTVARILLPAALPALITGLVLLAGRAFGEAAAILFTGSGGDLSTHGALTLSPFAKGDTLAVDLYVFRIQADPGVVTDARQYADGVAALLIVIVLAFNVTARALGKAAVRRLQGAT